MKNPSLLIIGGGVSNVELLYSDGAARVARLVFNDEGVTPILRHKLGVANIMWSSDYPHPVSSWPNSRALIAKSLADVPDDERALILSGNAARVWNL